MNILNNKSDLIGAVIAVTFMIIFLPIVYLVIAVPEENNVIKKIFTPDESNQIAEPTETPEQMFNRSIDVPFNYTVIDFFEGSAILSGEKGEMEIPLSENLTTLYLGLPPSTQKISMDRLQIGSKVHLKIVPGAYAWLYLLED